MNSMIFGTIIIFACVFSLLFTQVHGQSSQEYSNCIKILQHNVQVVLETSDTCNYNQFTEAVNYYKTHGYPFEYFYGHEPNLGYYSMILWPEYLSGFVK